MGQVKALLTTKTTLKLTWAAILLPFAVVVTYIALGKMEAPDFHQHLSEYTKWALMTLVFGKASHEVGTAFADRGK